MAYVKQNFVDGNVLHASELNHIEDGIGDAYIKPSGGIPSGDIADNAVTETQIALNAVTAPKIAANAVTREKLATDALYSPFKEISGNYTLIPGDIGKTLMVRNVPTGITSITITLPSTTSAQGMPQGAEFAVFAYQANVQVKIVAGTNAYIGCSEWETLYPASSNKVLAISHRLGMVAIKKIFVTDPFWLITGEYEDIS